MKNFENFEFSKIKLFQKYFSKFLKYYRIFEYPKYCKTRAIFCCWKFEIWENYISILQNISEFRKSQILKNTRYLFFENPNFEKFEQIIFRDFSFLQNISEFPKIPNIVKYAHFFVENLIFEQIMFFLKIRIFREKKMRIFYNIWNFEK